MDTNDLNILVEQAKQALDSSDFEHCELLLNQLHEQSHADSASNLNALYYKACMRMKQRRMDESSALFGELILQSKQCTDAQSAARILSLTGSKLITISDFSRTKEAYRQSIALFTALGDTAAAAEVLALLAITYSYSSEMHTAIELTKQALEINRTLNIPIQIAHNLNALGSFYQSLSNYKQAIYYLEQTMQLAGEIGELRILAACYGNIAVIHHMLGNSELSIEYNEKLLSQSDILNQEHVCAAYGNLAVNYQDLGKYDRALDYCTRALVLSQRLGNKAYSAVAYGTFGRIFCQQKNYQAAIESFQNALTINREIGKPASIAGILSNLGFTYAQKDFEGYEFEKAHRYLSEALELEQQYGNKDGLAHLYDNLSALYEGIGQWQTALEYFKRTAALKAEIVNEESMKAADSFHKALEEAEKEKTRAIQKARHEATEQLLHNVLPPTVAEQMLMGNSRIAESFPEVSIFFSDIVGFTKLSQKVTAEELVDMLNSVFTEFDRLAAKHNLEKVKTIGDAYMAVCGAPIKNPHHAKNVSMFALDVCEVIQNLPPIHGEKLRIRIGLHCGKVVAGVIGEKKFAYDLWGDTVNTASRMESHGEAGKIHVSVEFKHAVETLHATSLQFIPRGEMDIKGKGMMKTYFLEKA